MGLIQTGPGSPLAFSAANGGKVWPINTLGTSPIPVIGGNPSRQSITFHNPGTINVYVAMVSNAVGAVLTPSLAALGGTFVVFPGGFLIITGECQLAWQAFSASGSNNPITVMESNI